MATWKYAEGPVTPITTQMDIDIEMEWIYLPEGDTTIHLGKSYTGVVDVVLNSLKYGINNGGTIVKAFNDGKLLEKGIVHSVQNNLSFGNLKNVLAEANSQHLQFTITQISGTNPMEYYLYIYEVVKTKGIIVGVYRVHLKKVEANGDYEMADADYGEGETYSPKNSGLLAVNPLSWVEKTLTTVS